MRHMTPATAFLVFVFLNAPTFPLSASLLPQPINTTLPSRATLFLRALLVFLLIIANSLLFYFSADWQCPGRVSVDCAVSSARSRFVILHANLPRQNLESNLPVPF